MEGIQPVPEAIRGELSRGEADWGPSTGVGIERCGVVIMSVTEGEDKAIKYPDMFHTSDVCIINKIDLLPHLNFDLNRLKDYALQVNPNLQFFEVSATTGEGMQAWYSWLKEQLKKS